MKDCVETQVVCPACKHCKWCRGTHEIDCIRCVIPHVMACPGCETCGLCRGTHLVPPATREYWLNERPTDPPPEAA